ncbi:MAG: hypothetical protein MN733_23930 [Nitrososphaera sp.]|nr:hypothetical protein [Nitrososphaera sp.]
MTKGEHRRFTAEQKLEILREAEQAWRDGESGMPAQCVGTLGILSVACGGAERIGGGSQARWETHDRQGRSARAAEAVA